MNYEEFSKSLGNLDPIDPESELISGAQSIHAEIMIGKYQFIPMASEENMNLFSDIIKILESRSAVRGKDFVICAVRRGDCLFLSLHSTNDFITDEDFPDRVTRTK